MKIFIVAFLNMMIVANIYTSHKEYDAIHTIPEYESQESLDSSWRSSLAVKPQKRQSSTFRDNPLTERRDFLGVSHLEKVKLNIFVRYASKIVISHKNHTLWESLQLDEKNHEFQQYEASFFKNFSNKDDEYSVEVDKSLRKCIFKSGMTWEIVVDKSLFWYQRKIEDI